MASQSPVEPDREQRQDHLFRALADAGRRSALQILQAKDDQAHANGLDLDELAVRVVRRRQPRTNADDDRDECLERTRVDLYHRQIPILVDAGLVTFDPSEQMVALTDAGADVDPSTEEALTH